MTRIHVLNADDTTGQGLFDGTLDELKSLGLDIDDIRGQGYDNGSNMKGKHRGVQKKFLDINPRAFYTPCGCQSYIESRVESVKAIKLQMLEIREALFQVAKDDNDTLIQSGANSIAENELDKLKSYDDDSLMACCSLLEAALKKNYKSDIDANELCVELRSTARRNPSLQLPNQLLSLPEYNVASENCRSKAMEMNLTQVSDLDPMLANTEVSPHRKTLLGSVPESFSLSVLRRFSVCSGTETEEGLLERASIQLG
ncbi:zinc finger MYM-type protein 1-like protein [Tanacetum coccineum]|uniref:Zinc finger MYM-type protein 1-like protein n=1 Tax=Tanacetum coccineum TaxID=301880 RepID=A0ABQ5H711_9ASTR